MGDTIAGIAGGMGGSIGIIRVSGEEALLSVGKIFRTKKALENREWCEDYFIKKPSHTIHYGMIVDSSQGILDEVIVLLMKSPKSYTCEDVVEIDCHGGPLVVKKILQLLLRQGVRLAEPGEFTKRAFLNGRIDLSQAEAVMKMISSKNDFALDSALKQLEGKVSGHIEIIRQKILHDMGYIEAALDDPEHYDLEGYTEELLSQTEEELSDLKNLLSRFEDGRMKAEGIRTVIVGKPNAGKSSLMNLLLDEERAIVTDIAGTTRDILEEQVHLGEIVLKLVDTAGIHDTEDFVEGIGVQKAVDYLNKADFILYVADASRPFEDSDKKIISLLDKKKGLILFNKSDLEEELDVEKICQATGWAGIPFCSKTGEGLQELEDYLKNSFLSGEITYNDQIYLTNIRHRDAVEQAVQSLLQVKETIESGMPEDLLMVDMMDAYRGLGLINGETASEDLVNKIFSEFCMGK